VVPALPGAALAGDDPGQLVGGGLPGDGPVAFGQTGDGRPGGQQFLFPFEQVGLEGGVRRDRGVPAGRWETSVSRPLSASDSRMARTSVRVTPLQAW
jgi:hypothetical protein